MLLKFRVVTKWSDLGCGGKGVSFLQNTLRILRTSKVIMNDKPWPNG